MKIGFVWLRKSMCSSCPRISFTPASAPSSSEFYPTIFPPPHSFAFNYCGSETYRGDITSFDVFKSITFPSRSDKHPHFLSHLLIVLFSISVSPTVVTVPHRTHPCYFSYFRHIHSLFYCNFQNNCINRYITILLLLITIAS